MPKSEALIPSSEPCRSTSPKKSQSWQGPMIPHYLSDCTSSVCLQPHCPASQSLSHITPHTLSWLSDWAPVLPCRWNALSMDFTGLHTNACRAPHFRLQPAPFCVPAFEITFSPLSRSTFFHSRHHVFITVFIILIQHCLASSTSI